MLLSHTVSVQVRTRYLPEQSRPAEGVFAFAYTIAITNAGRAAVQLVGRHWRIQDAGGHVQQVHGLGVVGRQPLLRPGESFEYTSGCQVRAPQAQMQGSYLFVSEAAEPFDVPVDAFALDAGAAAAPAHASLPASRTLH